MKHPKLKNTSWCHFLLYSPVLIFTVLAFAFCILMGSLNQYIPDFVGVIVFLSLLIAALVYLLSNFQTLLYSDIFFFSVNSWKKDRIVFNSKCNGNTAEDAVRKITARCCRFGKRRNPSAASVQPEIFIHRRSKSYHAAFCCIERFVIVYRADTLDEALYNVITAAAASEIEKAFTESSEYFKNLHSENSREPMLCAAVIIAADSVTDEIPLLARNELSSALGRIVPCVVDCCSESYYFNRAAEPNIPFPSAKNPAINIIKKVVFGGEIPKGDKKDLPPYELPYSLDITLWEYLAALKAERKKSDEEQKNEEASMYKKLLNGEAALGKHAIYCKLADNLATVAYFPDPDEDKEKDLYIITPTSWSKPKRKRISARDADDVCELIKKQLGKDGYTIYSETL